MAGAGPGRSADQYTRHRVTGGGKRPIVALAAFVLAAALLTACGGSSSDSTDTATSNGAASGNAGASSPAEHSSKSSQGAASLERGSSSEGAGGGSSSSVSTPLKVSGGGSAQFRFKGGDNSIQEWGEESSETELQAAAEAVHGFYVARAEEDWARACAYLAKSMVAQLEQLVGRSPQLEGKGCAPVLKALTRPLPPSVRRETTIVDAGSLRVGDEHSFLVYYGEERTAYAMPLENEDGAWKLTLLSATPLG
jgi:hypothetical protein